MRILFLLISLVSCGLVQGQYTVSGLVTDENQGLIGVSVVVLSSQDSTLVSFGISNEKGRFEIYDISKGSYILQTSYVGYSTTYFPLNISNDVELAPILMSMSREVLKEVSISADRIPMGILGDTINYNAAAFQMKEGATVEDLLKKMPGIDVARDGSIKAFGEDVYNVLVDGKEFFKGDPTMATKNLEAEAVEKVQLFDKTSEESDFTGVEDGVKDKTLNLKLKNDYKNGGFGRIAAEGGTENRYKLKANYHRFNPVFQASVLANSNNLNENAFSFKDYIDFMGGFSSLLVNGGINTSGFFGDETKQGVNHQQATGVNFNYFKNKTWSFTSNYMFLQNANSLTGNTLSRQTNAVSVFETKDSINTLDQFQNHKWKIKSKHIVNPLNKIILSVDGGLRFNANDVNSQYNYFFNNILTQSIENSTVQDGLLFSLGSSLKYLKKYSKKGRNSGLDIEYNTSIANDNARLMNRFISSLNARIVDQSQIYFNRESTQSISSKHTEPIGKKIYLTIGANYSSNYQQPIRDFFDFVDNEVILNQELSSTFVRSWDKYGGFFQWKRNRKRIKFTASLSALQTKLSAGELIVEDKIKNENFYVLGNATGSYQLTNSTKVELNYYADVQAPQLNQLISIPNNLNPNTTILGNKELMPEYIHNVIFDFSFFDQFNFNNVFVNLHYQYSNNKIVFQRTINPDFTTISQAYQSPDFHSLTTYLNHSNPIRSLKLKYSITSVANFQFYDSKLNSIVNRVGNLNLENTFQIENRNKEKVDLAVGVKSSFLRFSNSVSSSLVGNFIDHRFYIDGLLHINGSWNVGLKYDVSRIVGQNIGAESTSINLHLINGEMTKYIKNNKWAFTFRVHDILNQNQGIFRSGGANGLYFSRFNTLGRYFTAGIQYKLVKRNQKARWKCS